MNTSFEMIHSGEYADAIQVAKKFVSKSEIRPILTFVQHKDNGDICATDSHRMIIIKEVHGFKEEIMINPTTFEAAKGGYPDCAKVVPEDKNIKARILLDQQDLAKWLQMHRSMNQMNKVIGNSKSIISMNITGNVLDFSILDDIKFQLKATEIEVKEAHKIAYCCEYMRDALEAHVKMKSKQVEIKLFGSMSPFKIEEDKVTAMVLPIRTA
jgi:DNA polymerase III sliding clamp (beta) subunit (PCNA family)